MNISPADLSGMLRNIYKELMATGYSTGLGGTIGNSLGQALAGYQQHLAGQGLLQQQANLQALLGAQQQYQPWGGTFSPPISQAPPKAPPKAAARPETNQAWLDRRVNEIRVRLA